MTIGHPAEAPEKGRKGLEKLPSTINTAFIPLKIKSEKRGESNVAY